MIEGLRHLSVFDNSSFNKSVHIIGCGATGSKIALLLAKLGVKEMHLWDFDIVESHNIANQEFLQKHIGIPKVEALKDMIDMACYLSGYDIICHNEKVDADTDLDGIVFVLTDTMKSRKEIWDGALKFKPIDLVIETRMGKSDGRIYTISPCNKKHIEMYEKTLYNDEESIEVITATATACRASTSVGPTSSFIASLATWQVMKYHNAPENEANVLENEIIFGLQGETMIMVTNWK